MVEDKPFFNKFFVHTYDFLIPQQHHELMLKPIMRECILQKDKAFYVCEPQKWSIKTTMSAIDCIGMSIYPTKIAYVSALASNLGSTQVSAK